MAEELNTQTEEKKARKGEEEEKGQIVNQISNSSEKDTNTDKEMDLDPVDTKRKREEEPSDERDGTNKRRVCKT